MRRRAVLLLTTAMMAALVAGLMASGFASAQTTGTTFTVNTAADPATPTTTGCDDTECTYREAINANNANNNDPVADTIAFNIPGDGPHTISPTSFLPAISDPVTIDGYTQGDATATATDDATENTVEAPGAIDAVLKIELNGSGAGVGQRGVTIGAAANGVVVKGLVINRFLGEGILLGGSNAKIEGNFIGTDPGGTIDRGNGSNGITNNFGSDNDQIGGTTPAARNLISGNNTNGVSIGNDGDNNKIEGNLIGTQKDGTSDLPNNFNGVGINGANNTIGGDTPAAENVIARNNCGRGVIVGGGTGNSILRNSIFDNGCQPTHLGIDLQASTDTSTDAVTDNDPKDKDLGPNNLQNFPDLTSATLSGGQITIEGLLLSSPRKNFTIRFFSSPAADADPTGFGEGKTFIGQTTVKTNRKGKRVIDFTFTPEQTVTAGDVITATATNDKTGDTSEFSQAVTVG